LSTIFINAIEENRPKANYKVFHGKEPFNYAVQFETRSPKSYQVISIAYVKDDKCKEDTSPQDLKLDRLGFGPGGGSYSLVFCASGYQTRLTNSELLTAKDNEHGIEFFKLAGSIQRQFKN